MKIEVGTGAGQLILVNGRTLRISIETKDQGDLWNRLSVKIFVVVRGEKNVESLTGDIINISDKMFSHTITEEPLLLPESMKVQETTTVLIFQKKVSTPQSSVILETSF